MLAAEPHHRAVNQHDLQAQHVVGGDAVFQAVHAAGILGHVAADGAGDLARGIGGIIEAFVLHGVGYREVGDAGLRHHAAVGEIDVEDAVELAEAEQDAVGERERAARERGAGAARHHLQLMLAAITQHARHLLRVAGQDRQQRQLAIGRQAVGFIDAALVFVGDHALARHNSPEIAGDRGAAGDDIAVGIGHAHGGGLLPAICVAARSRSIDATRAARGRPFDRSNGRPGPPALALTGLEARIGLVDDVDPALAPDDAAVLVPFLGRFQGVDDFHGRPRTRSLRNGGRKIGMRLRTVNPGSAQRSRRSRP